MTAPGPTLLESFDTIYTTDLVYGQDCWKLCGDAHCCNFARYKSQMSILARHARQEIPLLPGEFAYLVHKNCGGRFHADRRIIEYPLAGQKMRLEFLVGSSHPCCCEHDLRTTTCRLYPLLPVFDVDGNLTGIDRRFSIFEEVEAIAGLPPACKIDAIPFGELEKFIAIAKAIGRHPKSVFYVSAYQLAKRHAADNLARAYAAARGKPGLAGLGVLKLLEGLFALGQLLDQARLRPALDDLAGQFRRRHGDRFELD